MGTADSRGIRVSRHILLIFKVLYGILSFITRASPTGAGRSTFSYLILNASNLQSPIYLFIFHFYFICTKIVLQEKNIRHPPHTTPKNQHGPQIIWAPLNSQSLHLQMKFNVLLVRHTSDYIYQSCKHICLYDHHS
jgi:hypothetical protein